MLIYVVVFASLQDPTYLLMVQSGKCKYRHRLALYGTPKNLGNPASGKKLEVFAKVVQSNGLTVLFFMEPIQTGKFSITNWPQLKSPLKLSLRTATCMSAVSQEKKVSGDETDFHHRIRACHRTFNARIKLFNSVAHIFCHLPSLHCRSFHAVARLVDISLRHRLTVISKMNVFDTCKFLFYIAIVSVRFLFRFSVKYRY